MRETLSIRLLLAINRNGSNNAAVQTIRRKDSDKQRNKNERLFVAQVNSSRCRKLYRRFCRWRRKLQCLVTKERRSFSRLASDIDFKCCSTRQNSSRFNKTSFRMWKTARTQRRGLLLCCAK